MGDGGAGTAGPGPAWRPRVDRERENREAAKPRPYERPPGVCNAARPIASDPRDPCDPHSDEREDEPEDAGTRPSLQSEVLAFIDRLAEYGVDLEELAGLTPRRAPDRYRAVLAALTVVRDPDLSWYLFTQHALPTDLIQTRTGLTPRVLELRRKYIVAIALMLRPEFPGLRAYLLDHHTAARSGL